MLSFLRTLTARRPAADPAQARPRAALSVEGLEARDTPSALPAFTGLTVATSHLFPPTPIVPPQPIAPALVQSPVFALNFEFPPTPIAPAGALVGAFGHFPPQPIHSPVFVGVEAFLSGGGGTTVGD